MGNDAPLACLSEFQPLLYEYFKQLFAQVRKKMEKIIKINLATKYNPTYFMYVLTQLQIIISI